MSRFRSIWQASINATKRGMPTITNELGMHLILILQIHDLRLTKVVLLLILVIWMLLEDFSFVYVIYLV